MRLALIADIHANLVAFRRVALDLEAVRQAASQNAMPHAEWWASEWSE